MSGFNLSEWSVRHRSLVGFLAVLLFAAGVLSYLKLGRAEDPSFTVKTMIVTATWPGATADEMQRLTAEPIERKLQDLAHLDNLKTFSRPGFAAIQVTFADNTPPALAPDLFYQTRKKIEDLRPSLPAGVSVSADDEYTDVFGAVFTLTGSSNADLVRLAEAARDRLLRVKGAEKVIISGEIGRTIDVDISTARLAALGVSPSDIAAALSRANAVTPGGTIQTPTTAVPIRLDGALDGRAAVAATEIGVNGRTVRLDSIATVARGQEDPPSFLVRHDGLPGIVLAVSMQKGTNGLDFGRALRAEAASIRADLPTGVTFEQVVDQSQQIAEAVNEFLLKFAVALVVVMLVSFASLGFRVGIIVALSVPLTLSAVFVAMDALGIELQRISLGALILALGLLVDDAIIAIETMAVKLDSGWDRVRAATFAWTSTAFPMLSGTLVTVAAFLPVGIARSTTGEYAGGIFWVVGLALLTSWIVAVVFTPYLGVLLLPEPKPGAAHHDADPYATPRYQALGRVVTWALRWRRLVVGMTVLLLVLSVSGMAAVRQQFFPNSARPELLVDVTLRQGASIGATERAVAAVERLAGAADGRGTDPDVRSVTSFVGAGPPRFVLAYNPALPNEAVATILVVTKDAEARERVRARLQRANNENAVPEARFRTSRLELGPPVGMPVQFRVTGNDLAAVRATADRALDILRQTPGATDAQLAWGERTPSVHLSLDLPRLRALGLSPGDLSDSLQTLVTGLTATEIRDGTKRLKVVIRAAADERLNLDLLPDLMLPTPRGPVRVSQVARIEARDEEPILWRRNRAPMLTVQSDVRDGLQAPDVTAAALVRLAPLMASLPPGVRIEAGGAAEESAKANAALLAVLPTMLGAIALVLMVQLQSVRRAALVVATAPLGIIGAVPALLIANAPFGFVSLLGIIALGGMIMRNTLILVDQVRQDRAAGLDAHSAVVGSTVRRARPVVLTALAAVLAFVPLSLNVFWGPMAIAMIGGLLVATALTLVFLPALTAIVLAVPQEARDAAPGPRQRRAFAIQDLS